MNKSFISKFIKGSLTTLFGTSASILFHFLSIMIIARYIAKDFLGIYLLILLITQALKILSSLGLDLTLVKFISDEKKLERETILPQIFTLRVLLITVVGILVFYAGDLLFNIFDPRINHYLFFILTLFPLINLRELMFHLLQGLHKFNKYALVQIFSAALKFCLILLSVLFFKLTIERLLYIEIATSSLSLLILFLYGSVSAGSVFNLNINSFSKILKFSIPLYLNNIFTFLYARVNVFIIAALLSPVSVAYYEVARKIPDACMRIFKSFIVVYFPNIANLFSSKKRNDAVKLMNQSLILISNLILAIVMVAFFFNREIVTLLFSDEYLPVSLAFSLMMLEFYFRSIASVLGYSVVSLGYPSIPVKVNVITSVFNAIAAVILIKYFGFMGAVYSLLIMNLISKFMYYLYLIKLQVHPDLRGYFRPLWGMIIVVFLYYIIGNELLYTKLSLIGLYLLLNLPFVKKIKTYFYLLIGSVREYKLQIKSIS